MSPNPFQERRIKEARRALRSKKWAIELDALTQVRRAMIAAGVAQPPVDLERLANYLNVEEIRYVPLAMQGRVVTKDRAVSIEVNENLDSLKRQLCTAHELAHIIIESDRIENSARSGTNQKCEGSHQLIEELCDLCADEIILPSEWLVKQLLEFSPSLKVILRIAEKARLSLDFVVGRAISLKILRWRAIWWVKNQAKFQIISSVPYWDESFHAWIDMLDEEAGPVFKCWKEGVMTSGEIRLVIQGEEQVFAAECAKSSRDTVLCIIYPVNNG